MRGTVHLVYPHGARISCPDAIGRKLGHDLERDYEVKYYDVDEPRTISPGAGDVLIGHPHPYPWTVFRRSMKRKGWARVIAMSPYHHGDRAQVAFLDGCIPFCDAYLAITGNYWFRRIDESPFVHWRPRMVHLDLAVDRQDFPILKRRFNPQGQRKLVYIGSKAAPKNTRYLERIVARMPRVDCAWMGTGRGRIAGCRKLGYRDFADPAAQQLVSEYDFLITVGHADANPTTILEAMAWGLIPVCTPQSGYEEYPGIVNVPLDSPEVAVDRIEMLQEATESQLRAMQEANWNALDTHFNWPRFGGEVREAISGRSRPELGAERLCRRAALVLWAWTASSSPIHPRSVIRSVRRDADARIRTERTSDRPMVEPRG